MKYITIHWTAGCSYEPSRFEKQFYHAIIDGNGVAHPGYFKPEANMSPLKRGKYAAHCGSGNTDNIGVAFCGMGDYKGPANIGKYPLTQRQLEAGLKFIAELCLKYDIAVTPKTVFTHYEFGKAHPKTTSRGKIDINYLPWEPQLKASEVGDYIRNKIQWYINRM